MAAVVRVEHAAAGSWCRQRTSSEGLDVDAVKKHTAVRVLVMRATKTSVRHSLLATWSSHFAMEQPGFRSREGEVRVTESGCGGGYAICE